MVRDHVNPQIASADAFTRDMLAKAKALGIHQDQITVAGHSLGGTLAEAEAAKFHLKGATFNAFGAVGIVPGVPEGGSQVIDYVIAGDVVSAANHHYGQVENLATTGDIQNLKAGRYLDAPAGSPPPNALMAMRLGDHGIGGNFDGENSLLKPGNFERAKQCYADNKAAVDAYRGDVYRERGELALALRQMETGKSMHLPPDIQRQVNEFIAVKADPAIAKATEQNATVVNVEHGLQYGAAAAQASGQFVQAQADRAATTARVAGDALAPFSPVAPLIGATLGEVTHLEGQAVHAVGDFAGDGLQLEEHVVELGAHAVSQVTQATIHNPGVQAAVAGVVNPIVDTYGGAVAAGHAVEQTYDAAKQAAERSYDATKRAVSHGIDGIERNAGQAYDTLIHPGQWFEHAATPQPSATADPSRHQQRALHGEGSPVERAQEAQRQQEIHGHAATHEAPLPPAPAAIATGAHAPEREASPARQEPRPVAREQDAPTHPSTRHEPSPIPAVPDHAALAARQAQQQAMHAQRHAQQERRDDRATPSSAPGRLAEAAALAPAVAAAASASPRVASVVRSEPLPAKVAPPPHERAVQAPPSNLPSADVAASDPARAQPQPAVSAPTARPTTPSETSAAASHAAPPAAVAAAKLSPPLDPPALKDFRDPQHPLNARYQMFRDALGEQGFHQDRPTLNAVPEVRGYSAEQKDRLAAGFTAQLGADTRYSAEIHHFAKGGDNLLAVERPRELGKPPLVLAVSQAQTLARTPAEHAAAWRARELPEPQAVNTARPDPRSLPPDHPGHPDHPRHAMFEHAREALSGEYARWGIQKGADTLDRETMQVLTAARGQRMDDVGAIRLGKASPDGLIGEHPMLAVYSTPRGPEQLLAVPAIVQSQTLQQAPPVQQAAQQFQQVDQQATQQVRQMQAQINVQAQQGAALGGPGMGR